jgi:hypothetical protein
MSRIGEFPYSRNLRVFRLSAAPQRLPRLGRHQSRCGAILALSAAEGLSDESML